MEHTPAPAKLDELADKLERLLGGGHPVFTREDAEALRKASSFVGALGGDPATLQRIQEVYRAVEGFVRVGKTMGYVLAFVVVAWTQWDRLVELLSQRPPAP